MNAYPIIVLSLVGLCLQVRAQDNFKGFKHLPWGTSLEEVKEKTTGEVFSEARFEAKVFNKDPYSDFIGVKVAPPARYIRAKGRRGELIEYYFADGKLSGVVHTLEGPDAYAANRTLNRFKKDLAGGTMTEQEKVDFPARWGVRPSQKEEFTIIQDYTDAEKNRVRICAIAWPVRDIRKVFRVTYSSESVNQANLELIKKQDAEAAEKKRLKEEAAEKARLEREAARAAKEAKKAGEEPAPE